MKTLLRGNKVANFDFGVRVIEEPKDKNTTGSREHFGNVVREVVPLSGRRHDCEGRNKASAGPHKPDYVLRAGDCSGEQSIVVVGEIKGIEYRDRNFCDEDVGQTLDFIQEVLIRQGWRQFAYGFLTDGVRFEFFRGDRGVDHIMFTRSGLFSEGPGWERLSQLLQQGDEVLGFKTITVEGWRLGDWLGSGATSSVFVASSVDGTTSKL